MGALLHFEPNWDLKDKSNPATETQRGSLYRMEFFSETSEFFSRLFSSGESFRCFIFQPPPPETSRFTMYYWNCELLACAGDDTSAERGHAY